MKRNSLVPADDPKILSIPGNSYLPRNEIVLMVARTEMTSDSKYEAGPRISWCGL